MENILYEPIQTNTYFQEYLNLFLKYKNVRRPSLFIRYLNINKPASTYKDESTKGTFDHYNSGVVYDIYDYTPAFSISQVVNTSTDKTDMSGMVFDALGEISIYTIAEPRMGDLIAFPYGPSKTDEVFKVIQIDVSMHVREFGVKYHKLTLEYAPIKDLSKLTIINNYVYLLSKEKNIPQIEYLEILKKVKSNKEVMESISNKFNDKFELYVLDGNIAPLDLNNEIYNFLSYETFQDRFFDLVKKPFGIKNYSIDLTNKGLDVLTGNIVDNISTYNLTLQKI
jgi:hypothetical protein